MIPFFCNFLAKSAGAEEYTDCISAERQDPTNENLSIWN